MIGTKWSVVGKTFCFFGFFEACLLLLLWVYWFRDDEIALTIWWVWSWSSPVAVPRAGWSEIVVELPLLGSSWPVRDVTLNFPIGEMKSSIHVFAIFSFLLWLRCARKIVGARMSMSRKIVGARMSMCRHLANCSRLIFMGPAVFSLCWPVFFLASCRKCTLSLQVLGRPSSVGLLVQSLASWVGSLASGH